MANSTPTRLQIVLQKAIEMREVATQQNNNRLTVEDFYNPYVIARVIHDMEARRNRPNRVVSYGCASALFNALHNMFR